jgi:hypothetical protein
MKVAWYQANFSGRERMIQLIFHDQAGDPAAALHISDFRVTGGVLWNELDQGLIASYTCGSWKHRGRYYPGVSVAGGCCLLFGISRDPSLISEPIGLFSFTGPTFRANGVAIAEYNERQDMWRGLVRPIWWTAMRVISADTASTLVDPLRVVLLNLWDRGQDLAAPPASNTPDTSTTIGLSEERSSARACIGTRPGVQ